MLLPARYEVPLPKTIWTLCYQLPMQTWGFPKCPFLWNSDTILSWYNEIKLLVIEYKFMW